MSKKDYYEKLARKAESAGDKVTAENYWQLAEGWRYYELETEQAKVKTHRPGKATRRNPYRLRGAEKPVGD